MAMFYFHSDDFGFSRGISDKIIEAIENGIVSSVSLVANGNDINRVKTYTNKNLIKKYVHINLTEGKTISVNQNVQNKLTDKNNFLCNNFFSLEIKWLFSRKEEKNNIENAIYSEILSQISQVCDLKNEDILIDGHEHIHMSPLIFKSILKINANHKIKKIRLSNEIFLFKSNFLMKKYFYINFVKFLILRILSLIYKPILKEKKIEHDDYCFGIIHSGNMTYELINFLKKMTSKRNLSIQVILHPGYAEESEFDNWLDKKNWKFYSDKKRLIEFEVSKDKSLLEK